jgi:hypothetical protein
MRIPARIDQAILDEPTRISAPMPTPRVAVISARRPSRRDEALWRTGMNRPTAELLAQLLALTQVTQEGLGQERLGGSVVGPLKLVVTPRHVLDQVFHPEQRMTPISHRGVLLHSPGPSLAANDPLPILQREPILRGCKVL